MPEHPRAQLIHIDVDRRLGHEWDEWDGRPLPNRGDYDSPPALFFGWSAAALCAAFAVLALGLYLLAPRLALLHRALPAGLWIALGLAAVLVDPHDGEQREARVVEVAQVGGVVDVAEEVDVGPADLHDDPAAVRALGVVGVVGGHVVTLVRGGARRARRRRTGVGRPQGT